MFVHRLVQFGGIQGSEQIRSARRCPQANLQSLVKGKTPTDGSRASARSHGYGWRDSIRQTYGCIVDFVRYLLDAANGKIVNLIDFQIYDRIMW